MLELIPTDRSFKKTIFVYGYRISLSFLLFAMAFMILDDLNMSAEEFDWHEKEAFGLISQRKANRQISQHISPEKYPPDADYHTQGSSSALTRKRVEPAISAVPRKKAAQEFTRKKSWSTLVEWELTVYMLFEFATGYALFRARDMDEVERNFKSCEKYINTLSKCLPS